MNFSNSCLSLVFIRRICISLKGHFLIHNLILFLTHYSIFLLDFIHIRIRIIIAAPKYFGAFESSKIYLWNCFNFMEWLDGSQLCERQHNVRKNHHRPQRRSADGGLVDRTPPALWAGRGAAGVNRWGDDSRWIRWNCSGLQWFQSIQWLNGSQVYPKVLPQLDTQ